jgi:hypothetical protein
MSLYCTVTRRYLPFAALRTRYQEIRWRSIPAFFNTIGG